MECELGPWFQMEHYIKYPSIKIDALKLQNSFYDIMSQCLTTNCHVAIGSIVHCWEVVKMDIAGQDRKSRGGVLLTGLGLKSGV